MIQPVGLEDLQPLGPGLGNHDLIQYLDELLSILLSPYPILKAGVILQVLNA